MKKEGSNNLFISQVGKLNIMLLLSVILVFLLTIGYVEALTITINSPTNLSFNGSRNMNFTFNVTWSNSIENISNCSIYTNASGVWDASRNFTNSTPQTGDAATDVRIVNGSQGLSYANFTFSQDGNYTFNIGCYSGNSSTSVLNFSGGLGGSGNMTLFIDSAPPTISPLTPSGDFTSNYVGAYLNITSYGAAAFYVNVSDNSTQAVWMVLYNFPSTAPISANESRGGDPNGNRSLTLNSTIASDKRVYNFSLTGIMNFTSNFTGPGAHAVVFCANDTLGRVGCSAKKDWILMGGNVTQMESVFSTMSQGVGGLAFGSMNITLGNGTEIPDSAFFNPITGVSVGGLTHNNFTFIFTFSNNAIIHIVGASIDEGKLGNTSNTRINSTPTTEVRQQLGTGYNSQLAWADIASFIPSEVSYLYGMIQLGGTGYSKKMYCNGTTMSDPQCHQINQCNATIFGIYNQSIVIPPGDGCFLEALSTNNVIINDRNLSSATPGFTYLFVDHFSGGLGGADFGQPNVTFNSPFTNLNKTLNRSSTVTQLINFTIDDTSSTGLNLSANSSINVTITHGGAQVALFSYINASSTNLTCTTADTVSPQNTTSINCNVTFFFNRNGTFIVNITGRDTSNNSNFMNTSTNYFYLTVDLILPIVGYYNFTDIALNRTGSANFTSGDNTSWGPVQLGTSYGVSTAQGRTIFAIANWTDNLTQPSQGALQFFNATSLSWQTLNNSPTTYDAFSNAGWTNFSYPIPLGHQNEFEGRNISFRIIANDTLGNMNTSNVVTNFTILVNDTTLPILSLSFNVTGERPLNGTNLSTTTPTIVWNVTTEPSGLSYVAIQIDRSTSTICNRFANYTVADGLADSNRNGSITVSSSGSCPLGNGTHYAVLSVQDNWGNLQSYNHTFTIQTGVSPTISFNVADNGVTSNGSTVTSATRLNFSAVVGSNVNLRNISFTSSCNSTGGVFTNSSTISPFQGSCINSTANRTVTITATDSSGVSTINMFQFLVDNTPPSLSVNLPTDNFRSGSSNLTINISAKDDVSNISMFGYYLDGNQLLTLLNSSAFFGAPGDNVTQGTFNITFTPGRHTIRFTAADAVSTVPANVGVANNSVNGSLMTFFVLGSINFNNILVNNSLSTFNTGNVSFINLTNSSGQTITDYSSILDTTDQTLQLFMALNTTRGTNISIKFNASSANWDRFNFSVANDSPNVRSGIINNLTVVIKDLIVINSTINEFIPDSGYYASVQVQGLNVSTPDFGSNLQLWYFENISDTITKTNVTQCSSSFAPTPASNSGMPCWNNTNNQSVFVFVPHFSELALVNNTIPPTVVINVPIATQTVSSFIPNATVSSDAVNCSFVINAPNMSETIMSKTGTFCVGSEISNLTNGSGYNITVISYDAQGNQNQTTLLFTVSDTTPYNVTSISIGSISSTSAVVTVTANESVNITTNSTGSNSFTNVASSTFGTTKTLTISSLTASKAYNFTVITCDKAGNCQTNTTVGFTTSAAAAAAAAASTTSSSSSGGGGATTPINEAASTSKKWDTISAGTSAVMTVNKDDIAVTGVVLDVKNTLTTPEIKVASLLSNPISAPAASKVYQYLQFTKTNVADEDTSKITINFRVPKSWLTDNGVGEDDVALYRYSDNKWNVLATTKTQSDAGTVSYQATTPGFSTFAVGVKEGAAAPPAPTAPTGEVPTTAPATPPGTQSAPATPSQNEGQMSQPASKTTTMAWVVVLIIVVLAGAGYYLMQQKKKAK